MMRSLYSGVSGLKSHQTKMDVIGNNIANVNTYGYKTKRTTFKDCYYQTLSGSANAGGSLGGSNPVQVGYGATINTIDVLHTSGGYVPTGQAMDLFIDGEGYFIARDGNGAERYTRVGVLSFDGSGNLVDGNGNYICGYPISRDANGKIILKTNLAESAKIKYGTTTFDFGAANGDFFNGYKIVTKQDTSVTGVNASVDIASKVITITTKDTTNISTDDLQAALRTMKDHVTGGVWPTEINDDLITVNPTGANIKPDFTTSKAAGGKDETTSTVLDTAHGVQTIKKPGTLIDTDNDGKYDSEAADVMELSSISIGPNGVITGQDANGQIIEIGQVALANIPNPGALTLEGDSYLKAISNTGEISYGVPGDGTVGSVVAGGLENSNVDLANELTDMIITQRGFQANSRIITVGDEMLQELVNLKR